MKLVHGGDWAGFETEYGKAPLDLSANLSPLGMPEGVKAAAIAALETADRYPDPLCRELRASLAAFHGVDASCIVCGNGAADLIFRLCRTLRPKKAAVLCPGFAEYEQALRAEDCEITRLYLPEEEDFRLTASLAERLPGEAELLFLCNPNNPTGLLTGRETLLQILSRCRETGAILAVDECFLDFCRDGDEHSLVPFLKDFPELVILRAFTKTYAMAGLRLGYVLCGDAGLAARLQSCGQPWAVSHVAQAAGVAALKETAYVDTLRALISAERPRVAAGLRKLGLRVIPGEANYLLFSSTDATLAEKLRGRGILIRDCSNYPGLRPGWYRTAIRTAAENDALLTALGEVL